MRELFDERVGVVRYLRPLTLVATWKPLAMRSLAMPTPMSPMEMTPILELVTPFVVILT